MNANRHDESGQVGGVEVLPFGVLVFAVGTLLMVNAWAIVDAKTAVTSAAREAARTYVEAPSAAAGLSTARQAGSDAIESHGLRADRLTVDLAGAPFGRCERATFRVTYRVPALAIPLIGGYGDGLVVSASHTELVDPWRSGIEGGSCAA